MIDIEFNYNQQIIVIQAKLDDIFQDIINSYIQKSFLDPNSVYFLANGKQINPEQTVESQMNKLNKESKKMKILVYLIEGGNTIIQATIKSKDIICPICKELCRIKIENYKMKLFGCNNNHTIDNIKIQDFQNTQKINISNIICDNCKIKNKGNSPNNEFYKCLTCNINLCLLCKPNHNSDHYIIKYEQKDYLCHYHKEPFIKYCTQCNTNICFICDEDHDNHNALFLGDLKPNINEKKNQLLEIKKDIELFNNIIQEIIEKLKKLSNSIDIYYEINNCILNNYDKQKRNYQILQNIKEIDINNIIFEKLKSIIKINDNKDRLLYIIDLYNNIFLDNKEKQVEIPTKKEVQRKNEDEKHANDKNNFSSGILNQMTIKYNIQKNTDKVKLFGTNFVKNNKNNSYLIIDGKQNELCEYLVLNDGQKKNNHLEIKLIENKPITSLYSMFDGCCSLISLPDIHNWNTSNVNNMSSIFYHCSLLQSLPDISKWNTTKVTTMSFYLVNVIHYYLFQIFQNGI